MSFNKRSERGEGRIEGVFMGVHLIWVYIFDRQRMYGAVRVNCTGDAVNDGSNLLAKGIIILVLSTFVREEGGMEEIDC